MRRKRFLDNTDAGVDTGGEGAVEAAISDAEIAAELGLDPADFGDWEDTSEADAGADVVDDGSLNVDAEEPVDGEVAEVDEPGDGVREEDPKWFKERIDKILKREREAREAEVLKYEQRIAALEAGQAAGKPKAAVQDAKQESHDPVMRLKSFEEIEAEVRKWDAVLDYAMENLDGVEGVRGPDGEVKDYSAKEMRQAWVNAKAQLRKLQERRVQLGQELQAEQAKAQVAEVARKEFPFLYDAKSVEVQALGALSPAVRKAILADPNGLLVMGILAEGMKVTEPGKRVLKSLGVGKAEAKAGAAQVSEQVAKQLDRLAAEKAPGGPGASAKAAGAVNAGKRAELALERAYRDDNLDDLAASIEAMLD
jgi:hypothetical protein